jgi:replicative superfamily II helicase
MKVTPKSLIEKREILIKEIKKNWERIKLYNSIPKNITRQFDVKVVYDLIKVEALKLVKVKVAIQAINMGLKSMNDLPENNSYESIYILSQLKEQKVKLKQIPTRGDDVILSKKFIESEIAKLDLEIDKIETELEKYNSSAEFDISA